MVVRTDEVSHLHIWGRWSAQIDRKRVGGDSAQPQVEECVDCCDTGKVLHVYGCTTGRSETVTRNSLVDVILESIKSK